MEYVVEVEVSENVGLGEYASVDWGCIQVEWVRLVQVNVGLILDNALVLDRTRNRTLRVYTVNRSILRSYTPNWRV